MIWVRRVSTIPFGFVLLALLLVAVVLLQVSDTLLSPKFYRNRLQEVDIYRFVLNDLATSALDEARQLPADRFGSGLDENPLVTSGLTTEDLVGSLNRAFSPEWVQELVEQVLDEPASYITGDRDSFTFTLQVGDRVVQVVDEAKTLMRRADAYSLLFERLELEIERAVDLELPLGINVTPERLTDSLRRVVSKEWVEDNVELVLDAVTPYAVGDTDSFEIRVELAERVDLALVEIKAILREADVYDLLYDEIVDPILSDNLESVVGLPFDVTVTQAEVTSALRQVAPPIWVQQQAELIIDAAGRYVTKRSDELEITVDIRDNKVDARRVLVEAARDKFDQITRDLPECTGADAARIVASGFQDIPNCMPGGQAARARVLEEFDKRREQVESAVDTQILARIPDNLSFTTTDLRAALQHVGASDNFELLEELRGVIGNGWTYTDVDLKEDLVDAEGPEAVELLEDIRSFLADNWNYTEQDLRDEIGGGGDASRLGGLDIDAGITLEEFDRGRLWFKRARAFRYIVYLPVVLLLLLIGVLGGRTWRGRIGWAAGYMAVSAAIIFSVTGPVFGALTDHEIDDLHARALADIDIKGDFQQTQELAIDKGFELMEAITDTFASGVANKSALILALSLLAMSMAIFWPTLRGLITGNREPALETPMPPADADDVPSADDVDFPGDAGGPPGDEVELPRDIGQVLGDDGEPPNDAGEPPSVDEDTPERQRGADER
jgi:hypothetical protein